MAIDLISGLGSGAAGVVVKNVMYIVLALVVIGAGIAVFYIVMMLTRYNIEATIFSHRAGSLKVLKDRCAYIKQKDGAWVYRLLKNRLTLTPPDYDCLVPTKRGNAVFLYQAGINEFYPLKGIPKIVDTETGKEMQFKTDDKDVSLWTIEMMKAARNKFHQQSMWERYLPLAVLGMVGMMSFLILYVLVQNISEIAHLLQGTAVAFKAGAQAMTNTAPPPGF